MLLDPDVISILIGLLVPEDFFDPLNRRIYQAMINLFNRSAPIDPIHIDQELKKDGVARSSVKAIMDLTFGLPHHLNISEYAEMVKDKSRRREFYRICNAGAQDALEDHESVEEILDTHDTLVYALRNRQKKTAFRSAGDLAVRSAQRAKQMAESGEITVLGLPSGLKDVDDLVGGYQRTDLIITAARPSMGKTAKALKLILGATAYDPEIVVAFFSLEMGEEQIINRLICIESEVDSYRYRKAHLMSDEWTRVANAVQTFQSRNIEIDDTPRQSVMEIKAKCRRIRSEKGRLDMVIIDHGGLIRGSGRYKERRMELGDISKDLKALAKDFEIPVNLLFQLSRKVEDRADKRPLMSDLRESGEIEEDADVIELLYREAYYKETDLNKNKAEIIIAKNRNGPTGKIEASFRKQFMRFDDLMAG